MNILLIFPRIEHGATTYYNKGNWSSIIFGYPIISWDLGGQVQYREKLYFNRPELFFTEADIMLYVVDSQDSDRIPEAANYFREVLKIFEELHEIPQVLIVLSKSDQDVH